MTNYKDSLMQLFPNFKELDETAKKYYFSSNNHLVFTKQKNEITLETVLLNQKLRPYFRAHVVNERSVENIIFFEAVQEFKNTKDEDKRKKLAQEIVSNFLERSSFFEINVDDSTKQKVKTMINEKGPCIDVFSSLEIEIENVMSDSFHRFMKTPLFSEMCKKNKLE